MLNTVHHLEWTLDYPINDSTLSSTPSLSGSIIRLYREVCGSLPSESNLLEMGKEITVSLVAINNPRAIPLMGQASVHSEGWDQTERPLDDK